MAHDENSGNGRHIGLEAATGDLAEPGTPLQESRCAAKGSLRRSGRSRCRQSGDGYVLINSNRLAMAKPDALEQLAEAGRLARLAGAATPAMRETVNSRDTLRN